MFMNDIRTSKIFVTIDEHSLDSFWFVIKALNLTLNFKIFSLIDKKIPRTATFMFCWWYSEASSFETWS